MKKLIYLLFAFVLMPFRSEAQNVEYGISVDTTLMLIGDQQHLRFIVRSDVPLDLHFPVFTDTIAGDVEIISGPESRSSVEGGMNIYESLYKFTSFDTGVHVIPPQNIIVRDDGYDNVLKTDSLFFAVATFDVDMEKGGADIEAPYHVPLIFSEILPWILWSLLVLAVVGGAVWLFLRYRSGKPLFTPSEPPVPPYERALGELEVMRTGKLWLPGNEKVFYTDLTDILRRYLSGELGMQCMESTSDEILRDAAGRVNARGLEFMTSLLTTADLVKFAKMTPLQDENHMYFEGVCSLIDEVHASVTVVAEGDDKKEEI